MNSKPEGLGNSFSPGEWNSNSISLTGSNKSRHKSRPGSANVQRAFRATTLGEDESLLFRTARSSEIKIEPYSKNIIGTRKL
jgi:hypothetical protein